MTDLGLIRVRMSRSRNSVPGVAIDAAASGHHGVSDELAAQRGAFPVPAQNELVHLFLRTTTVAFELPD